MEGSRGFVIFFALTLFIACCHAQSDSTVIVAPVPPKPVGDKDVVGLILQNPTNATIKAQYMTFGHPFYKTQLKMPANTSIMTAYVYGSPSTTVDVQVDAKAHHTDGSVRQATLTLWQPSISAYANITLMLTRVLRASTPLSLSGLPNSFVAVSMKTYNYTASTTESFNWDIKTLINAAATQNYWLQGELAVQTRISLWVTAAMRMVFDTTLYKDNSWCVDVIYTNDIVMGSQGGRVIYDSTITPLGLSAIQYKNLSHYQYQGHHKVVCSAGVSEVNVQYDQLNFIQSYSIHPINYTTGVYYGSISGLKRSMQAETWGKPFSKNGVEKQMPNTGDRGDIGPLPTPYAIWFASQDADAKKFMMGWGDTSHAVPWNYYLNKTDRYFNWWDYYGYTIDDGYPQYRPTQAADYANTNWIVDGAHNPSLPQLPYIVSGSRYYLDLTNALGAWKVMYVWVAFRAVFKEDSNYRSIDRGLVVVGIQLRQTAWCFRDLMWGEWLNPSGSWHQTYFNSVIETNLEYLMVNATPQWTKQFGGIAGFVFLPYGSDYDPYHAPWQDDFMISSMAMLALQGHSRAADVMNWMRNFEITGAVTNAWNRNNRCAYNVQWGYNVSASGTCQSWECFQTVMSAFGKDQKSLGTLEGNYAQLCRMAFILYQIIYPQDTDAIAARAWVEGANAVMVNDNTYRQDPKHHFGNFPLAAPLNYTFTPGPTPKPGSSTTGTTSGGTSGAPGGTATSTTGTISTPTSTPKPSTTATITTGSASTTKGTATSTTTTSTAPRSTTTTSTTTTTTASPGTTGSSEGQAENSAYSNVASVLLVAMLSALAML